MLLRLSSSYVSGIAPGRLEFTIPAGWILP